MTKLQTLELKNTGLNDTTIGVLLPAICALPDLFELSLRDNELFFEGAKLLFEQFSEMQQLKKLDLGHTMFDRAIVSENPGKSHLIFLASNAMVLVIGSHSVVA